MHKNAGCNECIHPTCRYSLGHNGICACYICKQGVFVLDSTAIPKYRLACNKFVELKFRFEMSDVFLFVVDVHLL